MKKYRWENPQEWLLTKAGKWSREEIYDALQTIVRLTDSDTIQDIFQEEMDQDGYFDLFEEN